MTEDWSHTNAFPWNNSPWLCSYYCEFRVPVVYAVNSSAPGGGYPYTRPNFYVWSQVGSITLVARWWRWIKRSQAQGRLTSMNEFWIVIPAPKVYCLFTCSRIFKFQWWLRVLNLCAVLFWKRVNDDHTVDGITGLIRRSVVCSFLQLKRACTVPRARGREDRACSCPWECHYSVYTGSGQWLPVWLGALVMQKLEEWSEELRKDGARRLDLKGLGLGEKVWHWAYQSVGASFSNAILFGGSVKLTPPFQSPNPK